MITIHWVHAVIVIALVASIAYFIIDDANCGDYGFSGCGCLALLAAIIGSLCLLLAKAWGWV